MTASPSTLSTRRLAARQHPTAALFTAAAIFTAIAVFDLAAHPADQGALRTYKEYVLTATILPAVLAVMWVLANLHALHGADNGRRGGTGLRIATFGLLVLLVDAIVTLASGTTNTVGPLYPAGMLASLIGIIAIAIEWHRGGVLPRWTGPTLALGWFLGATPILGTGGAFLILAAALVAIAVGLRRQATAALAAPVELDSPVTV
jgi:hypothetical protein